MRPTGLDPETANRLVAGVVSPDDAPPGYAGVAQLLGEVRSSGLEHRSAREAGTVTAMQAAVLGHLDLSVDTARRKKMISKVLTVKAAAVAGVVLLGGGVAAAATGSLPRQAQSAVHNVLVHLDVSVPNGGTPSSNASEDSKSKTPNSNALPGVCNAAKHNGTIGTSSSGKMPNSHSVFGTVNSSTCANVPAPGNSANAGPDVTPGTDDGGSVTPGSESSNGQDGRSSSAPVKTPNHGSAGNDGGASSTGSGAASSGSSDPTSHS